MGPTVISLVNKENDWVSHDFPVWHLLHPIEVAGDRRDDGRERAAEPLFAPHARHLKSCQLLVHLLLDVPSLREAGMHDDSEALTRLELCHSRLHAGRPPNFEGAVQ